MCATRAGSESGAEGILFSVDHGETRAKPAKGEQKLGYKPIILNQFDGIGFVWSSSSCAALAFRPPPPRGALYREEAGGGGCEWELGESWALGVKYRARITDSRMRE